MESMALPLMRTRTTCGATRLPLDTTLARAIPEPLDLIRLFPGFSLDMAKGVLMPLMDMVLPPLRTRTTFGATRLPLDTTLARATPAPLDLTRLFPGFSLDMAKGVLMPLMDMVLPLLRTRTTCGATR